jgi:hypothetical protein
MADHYSRHADRRHLAREAITRLKRRGREKRKTRMDQSGKPEP